MQSFARRVCVCVCVCVCVRERERGCAVYNNASCVCVCERGRERVKSQYVSYFNTSFITVFVMRLCSPFGLELMKKLRTLFAIFTFILKDEARDYGKGRYISD